ncbi:glycosyltransferase family 4 protein [Corynebacterium atypicum]|uniref:glycosyltransferase family 4 protein n=1 Tax=Corynebacterium atypicum TaxID=191610 RepID=UPI00068E128E|nr:glycosyltransferase family 1 protein [Corynebacterium atypicum]
MRIGIVAESFLPHVNGVTNSVLRVLDHLAERGHQALVIAPGARHRLEGAGEYRGFPIVRVPAVHVPLINSLPLGVPTVGLLRALSGFRPDVIHLASPFVLGAAGAWAARRLGVPAVAVYQTDVAGFAHRYHLSALSAAAWEWTRVLHNSCALTLAPSSAASQQLARHGVHRIQRWGRGVDTELFHPRRRDAGLRRQWDTSGRKFIVGYVGRLAAEKGVERLRALNGVPDVQLVVVGDGPQREQLQAALPQAVFTGQLAGVELARAYASLDLFVHTGEFETFCQTIQEAQASGLPVIAPKAGGPVDLLAGLPPSAGRLLEVDGFERNLLATVRQLAVSGTAARVPGIVREHVRGRTWPAQCDNLLGFYREAMTNFAPRRVPVRARGLS